MVQRKLHCKLSILPYGTTSQSGIVLEIASKTVSDRLVIASFYFPNGGFTKVDSLEILVPFMLISETAFLHNGN